MTSIVAEEAARWRAGVAGARGTVLAFPYHNYLQMPAFDRVTNWLCANGFHANTVQMRFAHQPHRHFATDREREVRLHGAGPASAGCRRRCLNLLSLPRDKRCLKDFLIGERAGVVLVGSDLGGLYIRLLLDCCSDLRIPIVILLTVNISPPINPQSTARWGGIRRLLGCSLLTKPVFFDHWLPGSYHSGSVIAVPGEVVRQRLIHYGIHPDRVIVTGNPARDGLLTEAPGRLECRATLGIGPSERVALYCTEMIQEVFGGDYTRAFHQRLRDSFLALPPDSRLVVKVHPRESAQTVTELKGLFARGRMRVIDNMELNRVIPASDAVIAHFSAALVDAALMRKPILSVNFSRNILQSALAPPDRMLQVLNEEELTARLRSILYDDSFREEAKNRCLEWAAEMDTTDGKATERVGRLVASLLQRQRDVARP